MYNFDSPRYITKGIEATIPLSIQLALWKAIDSLKTEDIEMDYLQVFKLEKIDKGIPLLKITHYQEQPEYKEVYVADDITISEDVKIFVIDDQEHTTMLLSSEY